MLLNIYLGTTIISWFVSIVLVASANEKLKRKGYKFVKEDRTFVEKFADIMSSVFLLSIPVYNIINTSVLIFLGDKFYEVMEMRALDRGIIYKPIEEETKNECEPKALSEEITNSYTVSVQKNNGEMSTEEKLAYLKGERDRLTLPQVKDSSVKTKRRK